MRNYNLTFDSNKGHWKAGTKYLRLLNEDITSLMDYISYWNPNFWIINNNDALDDDLIGQEAANYFPSLSEKEMAWIGFKETAYTISQDKIADVMTKINEGHFIIPKDNDTISVGDYYLKNTAIYQKVEEGDDSLVAQISKYTFYFPSYLKYHQGIQQVGSNSYAYFGTHEMIFQETSNAIEIPGTQNHLGEDGTYTDLSGETITEAPDPTDSSKTIDLTTQHVPAILMTKEYFDRLLLTNFSSNIFSFKLENVDSTVSNDDFFISNMDLYSEDTPEGLTDPLTLSTFLFLDKNGDRADIQIINDAGIVNSYTGLATLVDLPDGAQIISMAQSTDSTDNAASTDHLNPNNYFIILRSSQAYYIIGSENNYVNFDFNQNLNSTLGTSFLFSFNNYSPRYINTNPDSQYWSPNSASTILYGSIWDQSSGSYATYIKDKQHIVWTGVDPLYTDLQVIDKLDGQIQTVDQFVSNEYDLSVYQKIDNHNVPYYNIIVLGAGDETKEFNYSDSGEGGIKINIA